MFNQLTLGFYYEHNACTCLDLLQFQERISKLQQSLDADPLSELSLEFQSEVVSYSQTSTPNLACIALNDVVDDKRNINCTIHPMNSFSHSGSSSSCSTMLCLSSTRFQSMSGRATKHFHPTNLKSLCLIRCSKSCNPAWSFPSGSSRYLNLSTFFSIICV
jgi:hypothetical protein